MPGHQSPRVLREIRICRVPGSNKVIGNPRLIAEDSRTGRIRVEYRQVLLEFYLAQVNNQFIEAVNHQGFTEFHNRGKRNFRGIDFCANWPLLKIFRIYYAGNYPFGDSGTYSHFGLEAHKDFSTISLRASYENEYVAGFLMHNGEVNLRFLDFNLFWRVENILDEPASAAPARNSMFGVFWNFLD